MPSEGFYLWIGITALITLLFGGIFVFGPQNDPHFAPPILMMIGSYIFGLGVLLGLVMLGGVGIDIYKRVKEWRIGEQFESLERKERELELEKRKQEVKRKEEASKEKSQTKSSKQNYDTHKQSQSYSTFSPEAPLKRTYPKGFDLTKPSKPEEKETKVQQPMKIEPQIQEKAKAGQPILETEKPVPSFLKQKEENKLASQEEIPEEQEEPLETKNMEISRNDYVRYVENSNTLRCLWFLYISERGYFSTQTEAANVVNKRPPEDGKPSGSVRTQVADEMNELASFKLVNIVEFVGKASLKPKGMEYRITELGKQYMKKAMEDKVISWIDFKEKYGSELEKKT